MWPPGGTQENRMQKRTGTPRAAKPSSALESVARQLRAWSDNVLAIAGPATDLAIGMARARVADPAKRETIAQAGKLLKRMREAAGVTAGELAKAVDLRDPALIEAAERGRAVLPVEVLLRVAGVLGRADPVTATLRLARAYNPDLWRAVDALGIERLVVQAGRERELANVYRASDAARRLTDTEFAQVLAFTRQAFDLAVAFRVTPERGSSGGARSRPVRKAARTTRRAPARK